LREDGCGHEGGEETEPDGKKIGKRLKIGMHRTQRFGEAGGDEHKKSGAGG
jgi:hypothetical protein